MNDCCIRYINNGLDLIVEWAGSMATDPSSTMPENYRTSIIEHAQLLREIMGGRRPCPWHDSVPEDYLAVMAAMGGSDGR